MVDCGEEGGLIEKLCCFGNVGGGVGPVGTDVDTEDCGAWEGVKCNCFLGAVGGPAGAVMGGLTTGAVILLTGRNCLTGAWNGGGGGGGGGGGNCGGGGG